MKLARAAIIVTVLFGACSSDSPTIAGPTPSAPAPLPLPPPPPSSGRFTLSGVLRAFDGSPVPSARVQVTGSPFVSVTTTSDDMGRYRVPDVSGPIEMRIFKDGYYIEWRRLSITSDQVFDVKVQLSQPLVVGEVMHGIVGGEPFDPVHWDARAPSRRVSFTAPASGELVVRIDWQIGSDLDLLVGTDYFGAGGSPLSAVFPVVAGKGYELILNSSYEQVEFELRADLIVPALK